MTDDYYAGEKATLERVLSTLQAEGEIAAAHQAIVAAGWQDILRGMNKPFLLATSRSREDAVVLAALADTLPEPMASWARAGLEAGSAIGEHAQHIPEILKAPKPPTDGGLLKRLLRSRP